MAGFYGNVEESSALREGAVLYVPQIRIAAIEAIARKILMEYDPALLEGEPCAIPIETIIETKFDLILEYHILRKNGSILGDTIFDDGAVILYD